MNRVELVHDTLPIIYHLSIVKSSKFRKGTDKFIYEYSVQKSNVFNNFEVYEFEMELDEKKAEGKNIVELEGIIKKGIKYFYSAIQDTNYPISNVEINTVLTEYMNIIHKDKIQKDIINITSCKFILVILLDILLIHFKWKILFLKMKI